MRSELAVTARAVYQSVLLTLARRGNGYDGAASAAAFADVPSATAEPAGSRCVLKIPYTCEGRAGHYVPDYPTRLREGAGADPDDLLTLLPEVTGELRKEKQAKVTTATDPRDADNLVRARCLSGAPAGQPS